MFSQTVEYALRAVVYLAAQNPSPRTTNQVATATCVPQAYLAKVLQNLGKAGIVYSQRGIGGGIRLARDPKKLTILDVINAMEPLNRIKVCPLGIPSHGVNLCSLHRRLDNAIATVQKAFGETTLTELIEDDSGSTPLCENPPAKKVAKKKAAK